MYTKSIISSKRIFFLLLWTFTYISTSEFRVAGQFDQTHVDLRVDANHPDYLILSCEVTSPKPEVKTYLSCPLANAPTMCFENCQATCDADSSSARLCANFQALADINCQRKEREDPATGSRILVTSYRINRRDKRINGAWACVHAGVKSSPFGVEAGPASVRRRDGTVPREEQQQRRGGSLPANSATDNIPNSYKAAEMSESESSQNSAPPGDTENERRFLANLTRKDLVISVSILLIISFFVNLAFCIRCLLVRQFLRKQKRGTDVSSLAACLCLAYPGSKSGLPRPSAVYDDPGTPSSRHGGSRGGHPGGSYLGGGISGQVRASQPDLRGSLGGPNPLTRANMHFGSANPLTPASHSGYAPMNPVHNGMSASAVLIPAGVTADGDLIYILPAAGQASVGSLGGLRNSRTIYDDVAAESPYDPTPTSPTRHPQLSGAGGSLNSLNNNNNANKQQRRMVATQPGPSPLPEENPLLVNGESNGAGPSLLNGDRRAASHDSLGEDGSSTQEGSIEAGGSASATSPTNQNNSRLLMSRTLLQHADNLLREAGTLLHE